MSDNGNFRVLMRRCDTLSRTATADQEPWYDGYRRGLRRAHAAAGGQRFGTDDEHELYLAAADSHYERIATLGRGYRAGLTLTARDPDC